MPKFEITQLIHGMFCCTRKHKKRRSFQESTKHKTSYSGMYARLDEFDLLTPLTTTPPSKSYGSWSSSSSTSDKALQKPPFVVTTTLSDSPPPPRRSTHGKTLIVPLNTSRYRAPMATAGTPDSRMTSLEGGTTKSCATIPEDDEDEIDEPLSIDRTSISISEPRSSRNIYSAYNLCLPQPVPEFQSSSSGFSISMMLPAPAYSPPSIPPSYPAKRPSTLNCVPPNIEPDQRYKTSTKTPSETSSPQSSSTGSLSDSFYINSEVASSAANSQVFDASLCGEPDQTSKYQLHRIEEESEGVEDANATRINANQPNAQQSSEYPSNCQFIPRSISQQFELMRQL